MSDITISYSLLSLFRNCRKASKFKYVDGLMPFGKPHALDYGTKIHSALDKWHLTRDLPQTLEHVREQFADSEEDLITSSIMLEAYASRYRTEDFEVIFLEKEFEAPIIDTDTYDPIPGVKMFGRIDGLVKKGDGYYLFEHKTASKVDGSYIDRLWVDFQIILYVYYVNKVYGYNCNGVIYNVLRKSTVKRDLGETEEEFAIRQAETRARNKSGKTSIKRKMPESLVEYQDRLKEFYSADDAFHREEIYISKSKMKAVVGEISELTKSYLSAVRRGKFYANTDHCFKWGRPCPYYDICRSGDNKNIIDNHYQHVDRKHVYELDLLKGEI